MFALMIASCGSGDQGADENTTTTTLTEDMTDTTLAPSSTQPGDVMPPPENSPVVQRATTDLAQRIDVPEEEIEIVSLESGVWSDGSIGCPKPGEVYTQALVPGHRVILKHHGETYAYHQGGSQTVFFCEDPSEEAFTGVEGDKLIPPPGYDE